MKDITRVKTLVIDDKEINEGTSEEEAVSGDGGAGLAAGDGGRALLLRGRSASAI